MMRCNNEAYHVDHVDRISDIPGNIIHGILERLPTHDLVRTSILSRKWRYMWFSVPQLELDDEFFEKCKHLEGCDFVIKSICLKKAINLIDLTICLYGAGDNFEQGSVSDVIKDLPKIERLCVGPGYIKILSASFIPQKLPMGINSLKYLELDLVNLNETRQLLLIVCLLKNSPNLVELVIQSSSTTAGLVASRLKELDCGSCCCLGQLQKVKFYVETVYEFALKLAQFILANSRSLEILTFEVGLCLDQSNGSILLSISKDLLHMKRLSQRAKVNFLHQGLVAE